MDYLYQDPVGALVQDLCGRIFGPLYQDPIGALVRDLCIKILWDNLCKISVSGSLCEDLLDHWYQDAALALVQDLCFRISVCGSFGPLVSGSYYRIL